MADTGRGAVTFTMTSGLSGTVHGYQSGTVGSVASVTGLPAGLAINQLYYNTTGPSNQFAVSGFSADPGSGWFKSITSNGQTFNASAATYSYAAGIATWTWNTGAFSFSGTPTAYPTVVNR